MGQRSACLCTLLFIGANTISDLLKMAKIMKAKDQLLVAESIVPSNPSALHVYELAIYDHVDGSILLIFSYSGFALLIYLCVGSLSLPSCDVEGSYQWEVQTQDGLTPYWEAP
jgi:hypothetical protein